MPKIAVADPQGMDIRDILEETLGFKKKTRNIVATIDVEHEVISSVLNKTCPQTEEDEEICPHWER